MHARMHHCTHTHTHSYLELVHLVLSLQGNLKLQWLVLLYLSQTQFRHLQGTNIRHRLSSSATSPSRLHHISRLPVLPPHHTHSLGPRNRGSKRVPHKQLGMRNFRQLADRQTSLTANANQSNECYCPKNQFPLW